MVLTNAGENLKSFLSTTTFNLHSMTWTQCYKQNWIIITEVCMIVYCDNGWGWKCGYRCFRLLINDKGKGGISYCLAFIVKMMQTSPLIFIKFCATSNFDISYLSILLSQSNHIFAIYDFSFPFFPFSLAKSSMFPPCFWCMNSCVYAWGWDQLWAGLWHLDS